MYESNFCEIIHQSFFPGNKEITPEGISSINLGLNLKDCYKCFLNHSVLSKAFRKSRLI
jgi:hypothetical protein